MNEVNKERGPDERKTRLVPSPVVRVLIAIRSSFIAFVATVGTVFLFGSLLLSGLVLSEVDYGVLAAMSFICGISAYLYGIGGYVGLRLIGYTR